MAISNIFTLTVRGSTLVVLLTTKVDPHAVRVNNVKLPANLLSLHPLCGGDFLFYFCLLLLDMLFLTNCGENTTVDNTHPILIFF